MWPCMPMSNPSAVMSRIRIIANEVDPTLRLIELQTMDRVGEFDPVALDFFARLLAGISAVALLLATAGVYALMSFTVARRTLGDRHPSGARREPGPYRAVHVLARRWRKSALDWWRGASRRGGSS